MRSLVIVLGLLGPMVWLVVPLVRDPGDDVGDGLARVVIAPPVRTPAWRPRTLVFLLTTVGSALLAFTAGHEGLPRLYVTVTRAVAVEVTRQPSQLGPLGPGSASFVVILTACYLVALGAVLRGPWPRKLQVVGHAGVVLALGAWAQGLLAAGAVATGGLLHAGGLEGFVVELGVASAVNARMIFSVFALPRPSAAPKLRRLEVLDSALTLAAVLLAALGVAALLVVAGTSPAGSWMRVVLPLYAPLLLFLLSPLALIPLARALRPRSGGDWAPDVDVITPAYNEALHVVELIESVDAAAAAYRGRVRLIVSDDGSTDATRALARTALGALRYARGVLITAPNGGKAAALNRALDETTAELVIRIDGDCVMDRKAIRYAVPWFADPAVGAVGALMMPKPGGSSWFHRLRAMECLFQFGLVRIGQQVVDGLTTIPGTFQAFRRAAVVELGGIVSGMNGEDSEIVMQLGRLGYRSVLDPRIRSYEDVPDTVGSFLEQRTRWSRAGLHVAARHSPLRSGFAGPRVWLWTTRRMVSWLSIVLGLVGPLVGAAMVVGDPGFRRSMEGVGIVYAAAGGAYLLVTVALVLGYRRPGLLLWLPSWFVFTFLRRLAMLEALLSLPCRPVGLGGGAASRAARREARPLAGV